MYRSLETNQSLAISIRVVVSLKTRLMTNESQVLPVMNLLLISLDVAQNPPVDHVSHLGLVDDWTSLLITCS